MDCNVQIRLQVNKLQSVINFDMKYIYATARGEYWSAAFLLKSPDCVHFSGQGVWAFTLSVQSKPTTVILTHTEQPLNCEKMHYGYSAPALGLLPTPAKKANKPTLPSSPPSKQTKKHTDKSTIYSWLQTLPN